MEAQIWESTIPLLLTHPTSQIPYLVNIPRLSYLPLLLPRLTSFYSHTNQYHTQNRDNNTQSASSSQTKIDTKPDTNTKSNTFEPLLITSFSYEGIQLKNLPVGLLFDLYQPELPWRLELGNGPLFDIHDTFYNSVKEADFVRNGTAKGIMSLSKENSTDLWNAVQDNDYTTFARIKSLLLNPSHNTSGIRNIPLRIYIPSSPTESATLGSFKIVQVLVPPTTESREIQTVGSALHTILPTLFPSRRDAILAEPVLHGAAIPFKAPLEEIMRDAAYADGWIHLCVEMLN